VKIERGWSRATGPVPFRGAMPSTISGTALVVESYAVYAFLNQVESPASAAKFG
jgi:hypothetical protein